jgi:hypothetical protein
MQTAQHQYAFFQDLERSTKSGLVAYLFILTLGLTLSMVGVDRAFLFIEKMRLCETLFIILLIINILQIFIRGINKINWLGNIHIWLDKTFFKFLFRSNEIILRELLTLLEPNERPVLDTLAEDERDTIAKSIFSRLADDQSIFESLLKRGIFRSWIWYWITIYGGLVFIILSVFSFSKSLLIPTIYSKALSASIGVVAIFHVVLGYNLILVTKRIMREIIDLYDVEIQSLLRSYINKS